MPDTATLDDLRDVIAKARRLVLAWRDADAHAHAPDEPDRVRAYAHWRDDAITKYNSLPQFLVPANPDMLATRLDEIRGVSRAMEDDGDWSQLAPGAADPFRDFARTIRALWPRLPDNGTPQAAAAEPLYRTLAAEFEPVPPAGD